MPIIISLSLSLLLLLLLVLLLISHILMRQGEPINTDTSRCLRLREILSTLSLRGAGTSISISISVFSDSSTFSYT